MNAKTLDITIDKDGVVTIEAQGFTGPECEQATAFLEQALGPVADRTRKPEYYHTSTTTKQKQGR